MENKNKKDKKNKFFEVLFFCVGSKFSLVPRKDFGSLVVLFATEIFFCVWFWRRRRRRATTREKGCGGGGGTQGCEAFVLACFFRGSADQVTSFCRLDLLEVRRVGACFLACLLRWR